MITKINTPTHIAEATKVSGDLFFYSEAEVAGSVEGNITQESLERLTIGRFAWIRGDIQSEGPILVLGMVEGSIISKTHIQVLPTARIDGSVAAPSIEVASGAIVNAVFESARNASTKMAKVA